MMVGGEPNCVDKNLEDRNFLKLFKEARLVKFHFS